MKNYFIVNPIAGTGKALELVTKALNKVNDNYKQNNELIMIQTTKPGESTKICKELCEEHKNELINIFACGGDGTCFEVLNGIIGYENVNFGMLPVGSCNDFLKSFKGYDFMDVEKQIDGVPLNTDIIKVNNEYIINVANFGFDARANRDQILLRPKCKSVKQAYNKALFRNIISPKLGDKVIVKVDGQEVFDGKILLSAVANARFYGGGYQCAPIAEVNDGLIDVIIVKKVSVLTFARLVKFYKAGEHINNPKFKKFIIFKQGKSVEIVAKNNLVASFDGEVRENQIYHLEVIDKKIKFIIPKK